MHTLNLGLLLLIQIKTEKNTRFFIFLGFFFYKDHKIFIQGANDNMETESEPLNPNLIQIESKPEIDQPLGEIIKKKKDKKKAKKEKLIEQLEKKRKIDDYSQEFSSGNSEAAKKIKFDNIFDAQKAQGLKGRDFTVSLALAGSILDNAQSAELRTYLAGQIARALAVFNIDEVIIFSDDKETEFAQGNSQLVNILKYLECPQYLRKDLFPIHRYLL